MIWKLTYVNNCRLQVNIAAIDGTMGTFGSANGNLRFDCQSKVMALGSARVLLPAHGLNCAEVECREQGF
ncbi:MAG: hypothetical protein ACTS4T_01145, partial [Candidatus Hodgkinia cicadicola]